MLILIATQTSKPFNGLTMDISGVPKEGAKDSALTRSRKFTPCQSKKAKTFVVIGGNNGVVKMASLWSFMGTLDVSSYGPANS